MKFGWLSEPQRLIPHKIVDRGAVRELELHHLSAADAEEADAKYPDLADGTPEQKETRAMDRACYLAAMAIGHEHFDSREIAEQMAELRRQFSKVAIISIAMAAVADSMLTPERLEAAKDGVRPTGPAG